MINFIEYSIKTKKNTLPLLLIVAALIFIVSGCSSNVQQPVASKGKIDLSHWDFVQNGPASLSGEWEFHWGKLLTPSDFQETINEETCFLNLPGSWHRFTCQERQIPKKGYATFRLLVELPPSVTDKMLRIKDIGSVCKIWANGQLVAASGVVGTDRSSEKPESHQLISERIPIAGEPLEIIVQISNFNGLNVGLRSAIEIGDAKRIRLDAQKIWISSALFAGMLLIIGLNQLMLCFLRRTDSANFKVTIGCLAWACYISFGNLSNWMVSSMFPGLPWNISIDIETISLVIGVTSFIMIYHSLFPQSQYVWFERVCQFLGLMFILSVIILPPRIYLEILSFYYIIFLINIIYLVSQFFIDLFWRKNDAYFLLPGYPLAGLSGINDILNELGIVDTFFSLKLGLLLFLMSYSFLISYRYSRAHKSVEKLSKELKQKNIALIKANQLKDEFLANTSHELKTPLHGIIGIADSLIKGVAGKLSQRATANLKILSSSGKRLTNLINDILDFSRLKNRDISLNLKPISLGALTEAVLMISSQLVVNKKLTLLNEIPDDLPLVTGDEDRLQQVLFNLIGNAIKFTDKGSIIIRASEKDSIITVSVKDSGIGITPDQEKSIFQPFEQVDATISRRFGGAGLGLGISRHLIELHNGKLFLESSSENGSTFCFTLPKSSEKKYLPINGSLNMDTASEERSLMVIDDAITDSIRETSSEFSDAPKILIVDDDPINLLVAVNTLSTERMSVTTANSSMEVMKRFNSGERYDLVLLDIMMPKISGLELCKWLRKKYPQVVLPVIMVTAKNLMSDLVEGLSCGANDYVTKPFSNRELVSRVQNQLKIKSAHETIKENLQLKDEIKLRKKTEQHLRLTQRRLSAALDTIDDALLAVNENSEICFCNKTFQKSFGYPSDTLLGNPMTLFVNDSSAVLIDTWISRMVKTGEPFSENQAKDELVIRNCKGAEIKTNIIKALLQLEDECLLIIIFKDKSKDKYLKPPEKETSAINAEYIIDALNQNRERLYLLENTMSNLAPETLQTNPDLKNNIHAIDNALAKIGKEVTITESSEDKPSMAVKMMNLALSTWCSTNGSDKNDFAKASGLWNVYSDRDGNERTQTLDRYLDLETFPKRPRWKQIMQSVYFVLDDTKLNPVQKEKLENLVVKFRYHQ